jgi:N-acetylmuramic acid 6-phosphate (MurNAc-6-P) etherase
MVQTIKRSGKVVMVGCGSSGRLLHLIKKALLKDEDRGIANRFEMVIAGGDCALVRSVALFEDFPDYGIKQLN